MLKLSINKPEELARVAHALSSEVRIHILRSLSDRNMNIIEIAEALNIPVSTVASNIRILEKSGLILTELHPGIRGVMKVCSRNYDDILMALNPESHAQRHGNKYEIDMPVGHFVDCEVHPTCGMAGSYQMIIPEDHPSSFFHPSRITARSSGSAKDTWNTNFRSGCLAGTGSSPCSSASSFAPKPRGTITTGRRTLRSG
ncbi:helix-turn-helix domain-containing protein [Paenibacillus sp. P25]|nr:helix-turn-helix domain-containing protein [Paenibacillus sp. P25]